jgi:hypothetical protein
VCDATPRNGNDNGWTYIECNNTCASDATCRNVYLTDQSVDTGIMARIDYSCAGNDLDEIDGAVEFVDSGDGLCGAASGAQTRNFHVLRMGVSCPNATGNNQRGYVFDDYYMECSPFTASFPFGDNLYTCISGDSCNGMACNVDFDFLTVDADVPSFADRCVESLVPIAPTASPALAPTSDNTGLVTFATTFVASWGLLFDAVSGPVCTGYTPTVQITCLNGNAIALANALSTTMGSMNCTKVETSIMVCTDTNSLDFVNRFSSIDYVSCDVGQEIDRY